MKKFFFQMLDSRDPSVSSSRFLSVVVVMSILYTWAWVCIYTRTIVDIPIGVYTFAGIVVLGKTVEKFSGGQATNTQVDTSFQTTTKSVTTEGKAKKA